MSAKTIETTKAKAVSDERESVWSAVPQRMLCYGAATLTFVSQVIHLWVLQEEFLFRPLSGGLIFLVAVCQGLLAASLLFGPGRWTLRFGIAFNAGVVLAWIATRFFGAPTLLGFARLPVEPSNLLAFAVEITLLILLFGIRHKRASNHEKE